MSAQPHVACITNDKARLAPTGKVAINQLDTAAVQAARRFHRTFPEYEVTPLHRLAALAERLDVRDVWVKDESYRFGLNAFKVLGGSFAIGKHLAQRLGVDIADVSFAQLRSDEVKARLGDVTFVTATDGNHGRGVAWAATQLGQKSVVFMPHGASPQRLANIQNEGAEAAITALNYDDTVRHASAYADEHGGVLMQDTAWDGYEQIPAWIMQGYCTLIDEALEQIDASSPGARPTHVFLQAGVGSFAASIVGHLAARYGDARPLTLIVEPDEAACIYKSARMNDGNPHAVPGSLPTIMAGLACGEPSATAWEILRDYADVFISCPDMLAARGMRILGNPLYGDPAVVSGESGGAVGIGVLSEAAHDDDLAAALRLGPDAQVLVISTEGDTDPGAYRDIVWDGRYPSGERP